MLKFRARPGKNEQGWKESQIYDGASTYVQQIYAGKGSGKAQSKNYFNS